LFSDGFQICLFAFRLDVRKNDGFEKVASENRPFFPLVVHDDRLLSRFFSDLETILHQVNPARVAKPGKMEHPKVLRNTAFTKSSRTPLSRHDFLSWDRYFRAGIVSPAASRQTVESGFF